MNKLTLFRAIGQIDEEYIDEAKDYLGKKQNGLLYFKNGMIVAASLCIGMFSYYQLKETSNYDNYSGSNNMAEESLLENTEMQMEEQAMDSIQNTDNGVLEENIDSRQGSGKTTTEEAFDSSQNSNTVTEEALEAEKNSSDNIGMNDAVNQYLSLEEAYNYKSLGQFLPRVLPEGFQIENAYIFEDEIKERLIVTWMKDTDYIDFKVSIASEKDLNRVVDVDDTEKYDLSEYSIFFQDYTNEEMRNILEEPLFKAKELSEAIIHARSYKIEEEEDTEGNRTQFGVLYDNNIVVEVTSKGVSVQEIYDMFESIKSE